MPINPVQFAHGLCDEFLRYRIAAMASTAPAASTPRCNIFTRMGPP